MFQRFYDRVVDAATCRSNDMDLSRLTVSAHDDFSGGEGRCDVPTTGEVGLNALNDFGEENPTRGNAGTRAHLADCLAIVARA